ncbi:IS110 family transposase [Spirosoma foliorum]|uniref:IS110 family transposase n=1 Tax=Spirosoma foliorum TaxID=2710596 RepID=A0A7G5GNS5_9BACT|nr:IS110 family transposase [Spirosoma foliorum]QMW00517.1 IS110 family transposase [Spirosoma foliorum]QMW00554.1 IS110 family transposase [Spirosoma foliorum]QMW02967.1 IS110 family transposase [Spirosoma foliorum]QMW03020.1 IS110 family transposase [Spirosoma foliorum]QMW04601.1 IS110 family transposase [Spirosoma foliorum]
MNQPAIYYGVDVSKETLHISYQIGIDANGQPQWAYQTLPNQADSIEQWAAELPANSHLIFEHTGTYSARLAWVLALQNRPFSLLTPNQSKGFAATLKSISKTDRSDAALLARYGQVFQPQPSQLADESLHQLRQQHKHLNDLRISQQAVANQLHALSFDPRASQKVKASLLVLQQSYLTQIALFEEELDQLSQQELQAISERMQRVKGIGPASSQALCTATNGLAGFESAKAVAKFVGIAPSQTQSGSSVRRRGRMARTGLGYVRGLLYMAARSARKYNLGCKALYDRLRAKGKCHKVAMVAVMNKLLHQVFVVVKKNIEFVNGFSLSKQNLA